MINIKKTMSDFRLPRYKSKMVSMNRPCKIFLTTICIDSDKKLNLRLHEARFNFSMVCSVLRNQSRVLIFLWRSLGQSCELEQHPPWYFINFVIFFQQPVNDFRLCNISCLASTGCRMYWTIFYTEK